MIIVYATATSAAASDVSAAATVRRKLLEPPEVQIPSGAIWIDLIEPTVEEDRKVQEFVGVPVPTKADPDFTEPPEAYYSENGVRYLHALFISEPEDTPDVTGVTFVIAPNALVTVRYHPVETFDLFSQKLCKAPAQALFPDLVALGLINSSLNRTARALSKAGESLDQIASAIFRVKGDRSKRTQLYSETLDALGRRGRKDLEPPRKHGVRRAPSALLDVGRAPRKCTEVRARGVKGGVARSADDGTRRELQGAKSAVLAGLDAWPHQPPSE